LISSVKRRFEQNQQDCHFTVMSLLPTLGEHVLEWLNIEQLTAQLQLLTKPNPNVPPPTKTKVELWEEIKVKSKSMDNID
jgi:peroxin-3